MVILALINAYLPGYKAGGPIQSLANLAEQLGEGFEFKIITSDRDCGDSKPYPAVTPMKWHQVGNAQVLYLSPRECTPWNLRRIIKGTEYDLLYLNSFFHPVFTLLPMLLRRCGLIPRKPVVLAPRGELSAGALGLKSIRKRLYLLAAGHSRLYSPVLWQASSPSEAAEIRHWFPAPSSGTTNALVAPDLPLRASFEERGSVEQAREEKKPGHLRLLFASRISPKKNLLEAMRCLEHLDGKVEFNVLGPADDPSYWLKCQNAAKNLPAGVQIRFWGPIPHDRLLFEMGQHDLFFLPTRGENFGHAILESLCAGCPVLISDETPWRDLDSKRAGWDLSPGDHDGFRAVLQRCIEMDEQEHRDWREGAQTLAAAVVFDDEPLTSNRDLFLQAVHGRHSWPVPRSPSVGKEAADDLIAETKSHFDAIAPSWERKYERGGSFQRRPVSFVRSLQKVASTSAHILDFGCGSGDIAIACSEAGYEITGIDTSQAMIARARLRSYARGVAFDLLETDDPFRLPYPDMYFDGAIASSVFEYVRDPFECFKELRRVCKPDAVLIATVPNGLHPQRWAEVVLRLPRIRTCFTSIDRYRSYGEYLDVSRNRFPLHDWVALLRLGGWRIETVQEKAHSLVMLVARAADDDRSHAFEHRTHPSAHVFEAEG